jgi:hypothetical protein
VKQVIPIVWATPGRRLRRAVAVRVGLHDHLRPSPAHGVAMPREGAMTFGRWLLAAAMFALPSYTLAQVRGGVQSGVRGGD